MPDSGFRYGAFISYRHVEPDRKWAKWLHQALETYRVPKRLVKQKGVAARAERVFRDEEELPASANLSREIETALQQSRFLIVVCSPRTPESEWVNKEIQRFREMGRGDRILALLIEGEPSESFPKALVEIRRTIVDNTGATREEIEATEPLAADVRLTRKESVGHLKRMAVLRMLACILGCRFDDLRQREQERHVRRLTALGTAMAALLLIMAGLTAMAIYQRLQADAERINARKAEGGARVAEKKAESEAERAKTEAEASRRALYCNRIAFAAAEYEQSNIGAVRQLLNSCPKDLRGWEWYYLRRVCDSSLMTLRWPGPMALDPEGKLVVSANGHTVRVWDALSGAEHRTWGARGLIVRLAWGSDGRSVAAVTLNGTATVWEASTGKITAEFSLPAGVSRVVFSPDSRRLAAATSKGISVWDVAGRNLVREYSGDDSPILDVAFEDADTLLTISGDGAIRRWREGDSRVILKIPGWHPIFRVMSLDRRRAYVSEPAGTVSVWDLASGTKLTTLWGHRGPVNCLAATDGWLATGGSDRTVRVWQETGGDIACKAVLVGHEDDVGDVALNAKTKRVVSSSRDGTVKVWDLAPRPACTRLTHGLNHATVLGYDGLRIAYGSPLGFHDIASGKSVVEMEKGPAYVSAMALSHDGKRLAAVGPSGDDRSVYVWDAETGRRILLLEGHRAMPRSAAFSHDDRRIVSCGDGGEVRLWNAVTGEPLRSWQGYPRRLWSVEFSPDDGLIVGKANDDVVVLWDASTGLEHKRFGTPLGGTDSMVGRQYSGNATFHPGGRWIASGNHDGTITVLDSHSGESVRTLRGHTKQVYAVSFSPDGNRLASASDDGTLKLWDVAEGVNVLTLRDVEGPSYPTGTAPFYCVVFSRDGCRLAAASARSVLVWDPGGWDDNAATPVPQVTP